MVRAAVAAAAASLSLAAHAGAQSEWQVTGAFQQSAPEDVLARAQFQSAAGLSTQFDATATPFSLNAQTASATAASDRARTLAVTDSVLNAAPVVGTSTALQATLWNLVLNIRAEQANDPFQSLVTTSANIDYTINGVPPPVPLPPAAWLFATGILGLELLRRTRRSR